MKIVARAALVWLALFVFTASAQNESMITVTGSRIVVDLLEQVSAASETDVNVNFEVTGTLGGFEAFCDGESDVTGSTRPLTLDEEAQCLSNEVDYVELLLGYNTIAIIAHPELENVDCLSENDFSTIFAPSAENQILEWNQTRFEDTVGTIEIILPADDTPQYALFNQLAGGIGLRRDVTLQNDPASIIEIVSSTPGGIGVVSLAAVNAEDDVHIIEVRNPDLGNCFAPTTETIETRQYSAVDRLFVYVNQSVLGDEALTQMLSFAFEGNAADILSEAGFTNPSEDVAAVNASLIAGEVDEGGRQFSTDVAGFEIPDNLFGTIEIGGASNLVDYLNSVTSRFTSEYPGVTINTNILGEPAGTRQFCNDQISIMTSFRSLPATAIENCTANNIEAYEIELGKKAVVLLANEADEYLDCVTKEQVLTIWGAESVDTITTWDAVNEDFPSEPMILVAPSAGATYTDTLLTPNEGTPIPIRVDTAETNADELYRATAVSNVAGSMTFMDWQEYQNVAENEIGNIQLVAVNAGNGCVIPSVETITDQSYPYTQNNLLIVNRADLTRSEVQSFVWYLLSDEQHSLIETNGLIGIEFGDLPEIREELQSVFADALANLTAPDVLPESTPPVGAEDALEATAEATEQP